jgi:hypothetical protein
VDVDYDVGMESAGRYGTRANRALANRAGASRAQDPSKRKQALARVEGYPAAGGAGMARGGARLPPPGVPGPVIWSKVEDDLLLAITHEFGVNWTMVGRAARGTRCSAALCPGRACWSTSNGERLACREWHVPADGPSNTHTHVCLRSCPPTACRRRCRRCCR